MAPSLPMPLPSTARDDACQVVAYRQHTDGDPDAIAAIDRDGLHPSNRGSSMELAYVQHAHNHTGDGATHLHDCDTEALALHASARAGSIEAPAVSAARRLHRGYVMLDSALIRQLRQSRLMSQQDLADDCWRRNIQMSLTTIKRAEAGRAVRFRIAREFARCFDVPVTGIMRDSMAVGSC